MSKNYKKKVNTMSNTEKYSFEDAYDIRGRGVGRLDLNRAVGSEAFIGKVGELVDFIRDMNINIAKSKGTEKTSSTLKSPTNN